MNKYIDVDSLLQHIKDKLGISSLDYLIDSEKAIVSVIESESSIEIIRCGECKRAEHEPSGVRCGISDVLMGEDGFCSIGKRKVNDGR